MNANLFDVIVIGSGIGGLTVASLLSQVANQRVLVLEQHFKLGGLTHTFQRKGFTWDVGLHYVGGMNPGLMTRRFMDFVTGGQVQWQQIPEPYDQFIYPGLEFEVPGNEADYIAKMQNTFPDEKDTIAAYFRELNATASWGGRWFPAKTMPSLLSKLILWPGKKQACATTDEMLGSRLRDIRLKALLASQWGNYGLPPSLSAFAIHALVAKDYMHGAFYPNGGAATIACEAKKIIERHGGKCLVSHRVTKLDVSRGRVSHVLAEHKGQQVEFTAPRIVSAIGAEATYKWLKSPEQSDLIQGNKVAAPTAVTLFIGLNDDPRKHGFNPGNYWIYDSFDHDAIYASRNQVAQGVVKQCFLSFPSLRTFESKKHTAELITLCDYESWQQWGDQNWLNRDEAYQESKRKLADSMIDFVDRVKPGFRLLVEYSELATPLTVTSMTGHARGAIYGFPSTPDRYRKNGFPIRTSVKNLFLTGCDVGSLGINGAMMAGVMTTALLLGPLGFPKLLRASQTAKSQASH